MAEFSFAILLSTGGIPEMTDYLIGIPLGIALNVIGIIKLIDWMADRNTTYVFEQRNLLSRDRSR